MVLADARKKSLLHDVRIPLESFAPTFLAFTPDEASVFACGVDYREDGFGFVVDVASGGIVATPPTYCHEWQPDSKGTVFQVDGGVIDLERRPDRPAPEPFPLEVPPRTPP